jgi:uncharacterized protein YeaO (DUF488 family)
MAAAPSKTARTARSPKGRAKKKAATDKRSARGAALIKVKRAYDPPEKSDGLRLLIDRLWPRGITKAKLKADAWVRQLAPSNELRQWYQHDPDKFAEFRKRYRAELATQRQGLDALRAAVKGRTITLVTATKALDLSHAAVLRELL